MKKVDVFPSWNDRIVHSSPSTHPNMGEALRVADPTGERESSLVRSIAESDLNTLILGETGVGKEVLAETLHRLSGRKGALVRINCAAIAPALFESELFGYEKGAFTGAAQSRPGLLEAAEGGTVFLDEIGELPAPVQAKLLRAIETREVLRVGAVRCVVVDMRFVAATNRDLAREVANGYFRSDLFFRLDGITVSLLPLRERKDQIGPLAMQFLRAAHARRGGSGALRIEPGFIKQLERYHWPGNVRELKAVMERAVLLSRGGEIGARHIVLTRVAVERPPQPAQIDAGILSLSPREAEERQRILDALEACAGNQTRAAKHLNISRATLVNKLGFYRIPRPRK
jgi:two-component system response regulator AtoC